MGHGHAEGETYLGIAGERVVIWVLGGRRGLGVGKRRRRSAVERRRVWFSKGGGSEHVLPCWRGGGGVGLGV